MVDGFLTLETERDEDIDVAPTTFAVPGSESKLTPDEIAQQLNDETAPDGDDAPDVGPRAATPPEPAASRRPTRASRRFSKRFARSSSP